MNRRLCLLACVAGCLVPVAARADLPAVIERLKPSVVLVGTYKATDSPRFQMRGTGFVVGDGLQVITNLHVLPDPPASGDAPALVIQVRQGSSWQMRAATLVGQDAPRDLALLRVQEGAAMPAMTIGNSDAVREGEDVAFMGFPIGGALGYSTVTHRAMVSSITPANLPSPTAGRLQPQAIRGLREDAFNLFQLDGTAYPGNSGGPLFNPGNGEVLGVVSMVLVKGRRESALSQPSGITYAVPARHVQALLERHR
ncbi:S1C family serine protease [Hydrogenophaga intermedia]|jgi:serine protease Do|uniref:S1C family serine protease n=1 Tax=Hydrogenophaga intermedia TaxID=65786 RepID=UPI002043E6C8|nr:serine protease [Hydrogenophaga intermedia]MCM3563239.1 serine protease [Hydrogenophaga intermedia]